MKPPITISSLDAERLEALLDALPSTSEFRQELLLDELARADIVEPRAMPAGVVTMNSTVRFEISEPHEQLCLTLSYPRDMPKVQNGISILTPIGAALLGLAVGDTIDWPRPDGLPVQVRLLEVLYQPEREGQYFR